MKILDHLNFYERCLGVGAVLSLPVAAYFEGNMLIPLIAFSALIAMRFVRWLA